MQSDKTITTTRILPQNHSPFGILARAIGWGILCAMVAVTIISLLMDGAEREQAHNEEIRAARCAKMGESIPRQMQHYCDGLQ